MSERWVQATFCIELSVCDIIAEPINVRFSYSVLKLYTYIEHSIESEVNAKFVQCLFPKNENRLKNIFYVLHHMNSLLWGKPWESRSQFAKHRQFVRRMKRSILTDNKFIYEKKNVSCKHLISWGENENVSKWVKLRFFEYMKKYKNLEAWKLLWYWLRGWHSMAESSEGERKLALSDNE